MAFIKLGESVEISSQTVKTASQALEDPNLLNRFKKFAQGLKKDFPKANDFLYFAAVMMHAAEASILDDDGNVKLGSNGSPLSVNWVNTPEGGIKWVCSDPNVFAYKNANRDIFPEAELKKAYSKWVGKPLCLDHKSSSVDMVRGLIVDTYYDEKRKRVIALCALDKKNHPDLARKVSTGYATSVSMGTAVGKAVCTDCGRAARVEAEYCPHMTSRSCYGEINMDLSPIELSIVVNGADPGAQIKHVIARDLTKAAEYMSEYVESKLSLGSVSKDDLDDIKKDLSSLIDKVEKLSDSSGDEDESDESDDESDDENEVNEVSPTGSTSQFETAEVSGVQSPGGFPEERASYASMINELKMTINKLAQDVQVLSRNEDLTMKNKKAYYQGTVDPTPGRKQYPVDPLNEENRNKHDKQMVGQSPFPDVGPVDGMHPGYASFGESEEARKKRLQRMAEVEDRKMRRLAVLNQNKKAYYQGTEEPKPGQKQYPVDPLNEDARNKHDKQMVGKSPFPNVGPIDGLYPEDLKKKEMLSRASLSAKFVKAADSNGRLNKGASRWDVSANGMSILSLTVDQITDGRSDLLFDSIHSKKFAQKLLSNIKNSGLDNTKAMFKMAQDPAKQTPGSTSDAGPGPAPEMAPAPDMGADMGGDMEAAMGEPVADKSELLSKLRDATDDAARYADELAQALEGLESEDAALEAVPEAGEASFDENKPATLASLNSMRKTLNGLLKNDMRQLLASIRVSKEELVTSAEIYERKYASFDVKTRNHIDQLSGEALKNARDNIVEANASLQSFVKYAQGTSNIKKRAHSEYLMRKSAQAAEGGSFPITMPKPETGDVKPATDLRSPMNPGNASLPKEDKPMPFEMFDIEETETNDADDDGTIHFDTDIIESEESRRNKAIEKAKADAANLVGDAGDDLKPWETPSDDTGIFDSNEADTDGAEVLLPPGTPVPAGAKPLVEAVARKFNVKTKEGRAAARAYLVSEAQKGVQFSDLLNKAHPGGSPSLGGLSSKPEGDNAKIETLQDTHKRVEQVATAPVKVQKMAAKIAKYVQSGDVSHDEVDGLVSMGIDPAAVAYYKQYWAQAKDPAATEFAAKLTQDVSKQKKAEEDTSYKIRVKKAYDLAYAMKEKGLLSQGSVDKQVEEILKWNDESYASHAKLVTKFASNQSTMPQVGLMSSSDVYLPMKKEAGADLQEMFDDMLNGSNSSLRFSR